jgi:hypothetical protein
MTDLWVPVLAAACFVTATAAFLNIYLARSAQRMNERRAYATALNATDAELEAQPLDRLLDLRTRLGSFAEREQDLLDSSIAAAERLDAIIVAKDTARRLTGVAA